MKVVQLIGKEPFHDHKVAFLRFQLWPKRNFSLWRRIIILLPGIFFFHLQLVLYLMYVDEDAIEYLSCLAELLAGVVYYAKCCSNLYYNDEMADILDEINLAWQKAKRQGSVARQKQLVNGEKENSMLHRCFYYGMILAGANYTVTPIISNAVKIFLFKGNSDFSLPVHS